MRINLDLDTVMDTLAGIANPATGWGIAGNPRATLAAIADYGEAPWFRVEDKDFAHTSCARTSCAKQDRSRT